MCILTEIKIFINRYISDIILQTFCIASPYFGGLLDDYLKTYA